MATAEPQPNVGPVRVGPVRLPGQARAGPAVLARISKAPYLFS